MHLKNSLWALTALALSTPVLACESCEHPEQDVVMTRHVRRMQPDAQNATTTPRGPLAWGSLNFLHTTDTHGWHVPLSVALGMMLTQVQVGRTHTGAELWCGLG